MPGDLNRLSIDAVFPGIRALELEKGSVIKGLLQKRKSAKEKQQTAPKRKLPSMISFPQGMGRLPEVLAAGKNLVLLCQGRKYPEKGRRLGGQDSCAKLPGRLPCFGLIGKPVSFPAAQWLRPERR